MKIKTSGSIVITGSVNVKDLFIPFITTSTTGITGPYAMFGAVGATFENTGSDDDRIFFHNATTIEVYNLEANKTLTLNTSYSGDNGGGTSAGRTILSGRNALDGWRDSGLVGHGRGEEIGDTGFIDKSSSVTEGYQHYVSARRLGTQTGIVTNLSNASFQSSRQYTYTGGTSIVKSSLPSSSNSNNHTTGAAVIGDGGGTIRARGSNSKLYMTCNFPEQFQGYHSYDDATNAVNVLHWAWDGSDGTANTKTTTASLITLPTHTGSTKVPNNITTSYGNLLIHHDTVTPANAGLYKITWSGTTPTASAITNWTFHTTIPTHEIYWDLLDGYGSYGNPYSSGEIATDTWNTIRVYEDAGDVKIDTIQISVDSSLVHTVTVKKEAVITIPSSSDTSFRGPIFIRNEIDMCIFHSGTDTFYYVENAFN